MQSPEIGALVDALSKAQAKMEGAVKDSKNPFFNSKYADLSSVWEAAKGPLTENGLAVIQGVEINEQGTPCLTTVLGHKSGQWIKSILPMTPQKQDPQTMGSLITYYRRYSLAAMVGICPEDDDGNYATDPTRAQFTKNQNGSPQKTQKTPSNTTPPSNEEIKEIFALLAGDQEKEDRMCDFYKVTSLERLTRPQYEHAMDFLTNKSKKGEKSA